MVLNRISHNAKDLSHTDAHWQKKDPAFVACDAETADHSPALRLYPALGSTVSNGEIEVLRAKRVCLIGCLLAALLFWIGGSSSEGNDGAEGDTVRILKPGAGFDKPTAAPNTTGADAEDAAKSIARWDIVPYQNFSKSINVGIVAFHINDIQKVSFSANGGTWLDVTSMSLNPETNVVEYWVTLQAADFEDGPVEVRAIAYPKSGIPRVLQGAIPTEINGNGEHSMWLYADAAGNADAPRIFVAPSAGSDANSGTLNSPVKTLAHALTLAGGMTGAHIILTEPGDYSPDRPKAPAVKNTQWITVEPAANLTRDQVSIVGAGNGVRIATRVNNVHWKNLTFKKDSYSTIFAACQWYDSCLITTPTLLTKDVPQWRGLTYVTDSRVERATYGFVATQLVRNSVVRDVYDAYQNSQLVLNCKIEEMQPGDSAGHHPDVFQTWGAHENMVIYGLTGENVRSTQVIFINQPKTAGAMMKDVAIVDFSIKTQERGDKPPFSQLQGPMSHILFRNVTIPNQTLIIRDENKLRGKLNFFSGKNVSFHNCTFFNQLRSRKLPSGVSVSNSAK